MRASIGALLLLLATNVAGEQVRRFDGYEVHHNAFRADFLPVAMARQHGLTRAGDRGLLNVTVLRARSDATLESIEADVSALVWRGNEPRSEIRLRAVREPGSISYLGSFLLQGDGPYHFQVRVTPFGATQGETIRFRQSVAAQ